MRINNIEGEEFMPPERGETGLVNNGGSEQDPLAKELSPEERKKSFKEMKENWTMGKKEERIEADQEGNFPKAQEIRKEINKAQLPEDLDARIEKYKKEHEKKMQAARIEKSKGDYAS